MVVVSVLGKNTYMFKWRLPSWIRKFRTCLITMSCHALV